MKNFLVCLVIGLLMFGMAGMANASIIYSSMPDPYPHNLPSLGYQATSTQEFGDHIQFAGTDRLLSTVTVALSDWAKSSDWEQMYPNGYDHDFTLNLYNVGGATPGNLITSLTTTATVPLRPDNWDMNGILFNVMFDFSSLGVVLPDEIVYGLAYNTQSHGYQPIGDAGPYNSLNFGLNTVSPSIGVDVDPDSVFWNTSYAGFYTDDGAGGVSTFRLDTGWSPYTPAIEFNANNPIPEPTTMLLFGLGLLGVAGVSRRKK